ncbi:MAG TPA: YqzL family protein [bacterium]|nr:YqzL family protein [bacterium]
MEITYTPETFWRVFEATGSIWAYLIYRQFVGRHHHWVVPILN